MHSVSRTLALIFLAVTLTGCAGMDLLMGTEDTCAGCVIRQRLFPKAPTLAPEPIPVAHCPKITLRDEETGRTYCAPVEPVEVAK
jgi:hypothetical protein